MHISSIALFCSTLVAAALVAAQSKLVVNTNATITVCVANRFTWSGGQAPFSVFLIKPLHPEQQLASLGVTSNNYLVYTPDGKTKGIQVGDSVAVYVTDGQGNTNGSAATTVNGSGTCASSGSSSSNDSGSSSPSDEGATPTSSSSSRPSASNSAAAAAASTNTKTGAAAPGVKLSGGLLAGVVGVLVAALM
ncbi:hypothetical protein OC846_000109 [Tilletia horrida]|uniref:Uncharacterized protein n=1 Tax=Tilletia horrida TaxID=155126 RepID=A0AAN6GXQ3_9BASI|nr:hypothetical protein OC846_000109 [Tilletia horrida]